MSNKIFQETLEYEKLLQKLLSKEYKLEPLKKYDNISYRPDFIVSRREHNVKKTFLVELKVQNIITDKVFFQILYYLSKSKIDKGYLAIPANKTIKENVLNKLLSNNIGIIKIHSNKLEFIEPKAKKPLSEKDLEKFEEFEEKTKITEKIDETKDQLNDLNKNLWVYIVAGGLLFYSTTNLLDFYFEKPLYLWICLIVSAIFIIISYKLISRGIAK